MTDESDFTTSTTTTTDSGSAGHGMPALPAAGWAVIGLGVLAGLAVYLVGLPSTLTLFGNDVAIDVYGASPALPAALILVLATVAGVGWWSARRSQHWTVTDMVVASVLAVAGGLLFAVWNATYKPISEAMSFFPPAKGLYVGIWLLPAVLGALVIRKPGAAVYTELVAATISALIGSEWGLAVVWYGLLQGLGVELVVALFLYRRYGPVVALLGGAAAGLVAGLLDLLTTYPTFSIGWKVSYVAAVMLSGAVIAGGGGVLLTRALARTGALAPLAAGRETERV